MNACSQEKWEIENLKLGDEQVKKTKMKNYYLCSHNELWTGLNPDDFDIYKSKKFKTRGIKTQ